MREIVVVLSILAVVAIVVFAIKWLFSSPSDSSDSWLEAEDTEYNPTGAIITGAVIGAGVGTILNEEMYPPNPPMGAFDPAELPEAESMATEIADSPEQNESADQEDE